jgi:enoyl-CoA hydratase/carnithine racemase
MSRGPWTVRRDGRVATLAFASPPDHHVRLTDLDDLRAVLDPLGRDDEVSVVAITGAEPGHFIGHASRDDIAALRAGADGPTFTQAWAAATTALEQLPQPVVALVDGPAQGGGCELSLACSLRLAGPHASFQQHEILRGAMPGAGATQRLPRLIGAGRAARMVLTGARVGGEEAHRIGLADDYFGDEGATAEMHAWVHELSQRRREALVAAKVACRAALHLPLDEGLRREQDLFLDLLKCS